MLKIKQNQFEMAKQLTITDIASMAGVSAGTVDRILHNRGKVSEEAERKVDEVLRNNGYKPNIHTSAVSLKKEYSIVGCMPNSNNGDYWQSIQDGISKALDEYSDIDIRYSCISYDQLDVRSCERAYESVLNNDCDAVILGPTFESMTEELCRELDKKKTPYVFVDATLEQANPIAVITSDRAVCGRLMGELMTMLCRSGEEMAIFHVFRKGGGKSMNSVARGKALMEYIRKSGIKKAVKESSIRLDTPAESERSINEFFKTNPAVKVAGVLNSKGYFIADVLKELGRNDVRTVAFDITYNNRRCIKDGSIKALICQRPETQGFEAIKAIIEYLIYGTKGKKSTMPVDIVLKENLALYSENR